MTEAEREHEAKYQAYLAEQAQHKTAAKGRRETREDLATGKKLAMAWMRDLRSMQTYVGKYTLTLRKAINPKTEREWTDEERGIEFRRLWCEGGLDLITGKETSEILRLLKHPVAFPPGTPGSKRKKPWHPPGEGYVKTDSTAFHLLDSIICDPVWDNKFPALIDARLTFGNESYFHVLRKWGTKQSDFSRHYAIAIWCAVLSWNENVGRLTLEHVWRRRKSGQLASQGGRYYKVAIRTPQTDFWRMEGWQAYRATLVSGTRTRREASGQVECSFSLGWYGRDPPVAPPIRLPAPATATKPLELLTVPEMKSELAAIGVFPTSSKKPDLLKLVTEARDDADAVRSAAAPKPAQTLLPEVEAIPIRSPRGSPRRERREAPAAASLPMAVPSFRLPDPYSLPQAQRRRRQPQPAGQKKWTAKRIKAALEKVEAGGQPSPLRRVRGEDVEEPPERDGDEESEGGEEGEEGEEAEEGEEGEGGEEGEEMADEAEEGE